MDKLLNWTPSEIAKSIIIAMAVIIVVWDTMKKIEDLLGFYYKNRKMKETFRDTLKRNAQTDASQIQQINELKDKNEALIQALKVIMRHEIITNCEYALSTNIIGAAELQSLEDLYAVYSSAPFMGNSYAKTIMEKVRTSVPVDYTNWNPGSDGHRRMNNTNNIISNNNTNNNNTNSNNVSNNNSVSTDDKGGN